MKKLISLTLLSFLCLNSVNVLAGENESSEYKPMLTEGKTWKVLAERELNSDYYITYTVSGDTVVGGRTCKRILVDNGTTTPAIAAYEEDKKLYCYLFEGDKPRLMLDFGLEKGDIAYDYRPTGGVLYVTDVDYIRVNGIERKRIKIVDSNNSRTIYWVEGIGINQDNWMDTTIAVVDGESHYLQECYENGRLIFKASDFDVANSIEDISTFCIKNECKYSLTGIRLGSASNCPVYIQGGKKYVNR